MHYLSCIFVLVFGCRKAAAADATICIAGNVEITIKHDDDLVNANNKTSCSGGSVQLQWAASFAPTSTLRVGPNTYVSVAPINGKEILISGDGLNDGEHLFAVDGGLLRLSNITITDTRVILDNNETCGGVIFATNEAEVILDGTTRITNSFTNGFGGAICANSSSNVTITDSVTLSNNTARICGGAIAAFGSSVISINGLARVEHNQAEGFWDHDKSGGAVFIGDYSTLFASGNASFAHNHVYHPDGFPQGGAIGIQWSTVFISDAVSIRDNHGARWGGGIKCTGWYEEKDVDTGLRTFFEGGTAALYLSGSVSITGNVVSANGQNAETGEDINGEGGGIAADRSCFVSITDDVVISGNEVDGDGGGVSLWNGASILLDGNAAILENWAGHNGGGVTIRTECSLEMRGSARIAHNNGTFGGGISAYGSSDVTLSANADVAYNIATTTSLEAGGGIKLAKESFLQMSGSSHLHHNTALNGDGGGLYHQCNEDGGDVEPSRIWGNAKITDNHAANEGGGAVVSNGYTACVLVLEDGVEVSRNFAKAGGGGLMGYEKSAFVISGNVRIVNNTAESGGGGGIKINSDCQVNVTDGVLFAGNTCGLSGGAMWVTDRSAASFSNNVLFERNSAAVGGALTASEACILGLHDNVRFTGNTARTSGGAISATTDLTLHADGSVVFERNKVELGNGGAIALFDAVGTITGASFLSNEGLSGGGIAVLESVLKCNYASFSNNTATGQGGAVILLSGSVSLADCSFTGNSALTGGGVYSTDTPGTAEGYVDSFMTEGKTLFENNYATCCTISKANMNGQYDCSGVNYGTSGNECCQASDYATYAMKSDEHYSTCAACDLRTTDCHTLAITLETLPLKSGHWRPSINSTNIQRCIITKGCEGGASNASQGTDGYCKRGYEGILCGVCSSGYSPTLGRQCQKCERGRMVGVGVVVALVLLFVAITIALFIQELFTQPRSQPLAPDTDVAVLLSAAGESGESECGFLRKSCSQHFKLRKLRAPIVVFQIVTGFVAITGTEFPAPYGNFLDVINIFSFDASWLLQAGCLVSITFYDKLLIATLGPVIVVAMAVALYFYLLRHIESRCSVYGRLKSSLDCPPRNHHIATELPFWKSPAPTILPSLVSNRSSEDMSILAPVNAPFHEEAPCGSTPDSSEPPVAAASVDHLARAAGGQVNLSGREQAETGMQVNLSGREQAEAGIVSEGDPVSKRQDVDSRGFDTAKRAEREFSFKTEAEFEERIWSKKVEIHLTTAVVIVLFLVYSTVSTVIFQTFACDVSFEEELHESFLYTDYSVQCYTATHKRFMVYASIFALIYPIGIPVASFFLLARWLNDSASRDDEDNGSSGLSGSSSEGASSIRLHKSGEPAPDEVGNLYGGTRARSAGSTTDKKQADKGRIIIYYPSTATRRLGFALPENKAKAMLMGDYTEEHVYWESVEFLRRLMMTGVLVFISPGTANQATAACIFAVMFMVYAVVKQPFRMSADTKVYMGGCVVVLMSFFLALLVKVDVSQEDSQSQRVFSILLVLLNTGMIALGTWTAWNGQYDIRNLPRLAG